MELRKDSLSKLIFNVEQEESAKNVLTLMRQQHPAILRLCNDEETDILTDTVCQYIAELGLKEILDTLKTIPIQDSHLFAGSVLVAIKDIYLVKKYLWRDSEFIPTMCKLLNSSKQQNKVILRDIVASVFRSTVLGGTPTAYYELAAQSDLIELLLDILKSKLRVVYKDSYGEVMLTLLLLCQSNTSCTKRCNQLFIYEILESFALWDELDSDLKEKAEVARGCILHMTNQDSLPYHKKLLLNKFSHHMNKKNKTFKRMETIVCSFVDCSKVEPDTVEGRFKKCARCRVALYCSKECQRAHWKNGHSKHCTEPTQTSTSNK